MSSNKNRDVAQELVDFLLKDEQQKKTELAQSGEKKAVPKPALVPPIPTVPPVPGGKAADTHALDASTIVPANKKTSEAPGIVEFSISTPETKTESKGVEFKSQPSSSQGLSTQRSKIVFNEVSSLMAGVEAVKVAQARITVLEKEKSRLRDEIDQLLLASETLQRRFNELKTEHDAFERRHKEKIEILEDEKTVLRSRLKAKEDDLERYKKENDELKMRFQTDLRKVRVRERELETRQEIMKSEHSSVVRAKDELIIELKRQLEKLHFELDNFRAQSADLNAKVTEFYDRNHRTVKALRLALSVLEAGDGDDKNKKAG